MKKEYYCPSADDLTQMHECEWTPEGEPKAILQIAHGMKEYIERYEEFAEVLSARGILVVGNDHLGHGRSVADEESYGFFSDNMGPDDVLADMHSLRERTQAEHPSVPYFLLGHSMGSAFARCYITRHSEGLAGVIIMGSFTAPPAAVVVAKRLCKFSAALKGGNHYSKMIDGMAGGGYNKEFTNPETPVDWLSKNPENNKKYENDPMCNHPFSVNAYYGMFEALQQAEKPKLMDQINKDLPIVLVSGDEDPVGHHGKDIPRIAKWYKEIGVKEVAYKLYKGDRHEILNELDRQRVYADLERWILKHIKDN